MMMFGFFMGAQQCSELTPCFLLGITPSRTWGTISGAGDRNQVNLTTVLSLIYMYYTHKYSILNTITKNVTF